MTTLAYYAPTRLIFGPGCITRAGRIVAELGNRVLLVIGRSAMDSSGVSGRLMDDLSMQQLSVERFTISRHGPTTTDIDRGVDVCRRHKVDVVVALGGGSSLDCGKAIAGVASVNAGAEDVLYGRVAIQRHALPIVCIPTTAGTGSEMNRSAIITDPTTPFKDGIRSDYLFPRYAIVDSELTWTLPARITAQTGFDVLAHAVESYLSPKASPFCDGLALQTIRLVRQWLSIAINDPQHPLARNQMAWASTMMGVNLACVGTCFPHRADKSLCALRPDISHGQSVAYFYPYWLKACQDVSENRLAEIAAVWSPETASISPTESSRYCRDELLRFVAELGLAMSLGQAGIKEADIPQLVRGVAGDLTVNPVPLQRDELPGVFRQILSEQS